MARLNEKTIDTEKKIHLLITEKCDRNCPDCCNFQYDMSKIPYVTKAELAKAEWVFLTGGEPFAYADPCLTAFEFKDSYPNIKKIIVYTNALELYAYLERYGLHSIDGLTISIKNNYDKAAFEYICDNPNLQLLDTVWVYVFPGFENTKVPDRFNKKLRVWQKDFVPATDSIFRKLKE